MIHNTVFWSRGMMGSIEDFDERDPTSYFRDILDKVSYGVAAIASKKRRLDNNGCT